MTAEEEQAVDAHDRHLEALTTVFHEMTAPEISDGEVQSMIDALRASWSALSAIADLRGFSDTASGPTPSVELVYWWSEQVGAWFRVRDDVLTIIASRASFTLPQPADLKNDGDVELWGTRVGRYGFELDG